jgi:hypothetical protein
MTKAKANKWLSNYKGLHGTTKMSVAMKEFRLTPLSLTYMMTLFIKLNLTNRTFICFVKAEPKLSGASNSPTIM